MKRRANDVIMVQSAVLAELVEELREDDGLDECAQVLERVVARLELSDDPYDRVRAVVVDLETVYHRLSESAFTEAQHRQAQNIREIQRRLRRAVDAELGDTQPIDLFPSRRRRDPPGES